MKTLFVLFATTVLSISAFADDIADAKMAFATMVEYQRTDDERSPDLFSKSCIITATLRDGANKKTMVIPLEAFIAQMKAQIAKKVGATEAYEDVKYQQEDSGIRVTAKIRYLQNGRGGPFSMLYRRDEDGVMRIRQLEIIVYPEK